MSSNFELTLTKPKIKSAWNEDDLQWKQPQNIKSWISQQPLVGSSSNFKLKLRGPYNFKKNEMKITSNGRRPQILIVEYLSNHYSDIPQILNLSLGDQNKIEKLLKIKTTSNGKRPQNNESGISE